MFPLRSCSVVQHDAHPGSERVGDEARAAGVPCRRVSLEYLDGETDGEPEYDGDESRPLGFV